MIQICKIMKVSGLIVPIAAAMLMTGCGSEKVQTTEPPAPVAESKVEQVKQPTPEEVAVPKLRVAEIKQDNTLPEKTQRRIEEAAEQRRIEEMAEQTARQAVPQVTTYMKNLPGTQNQILTVRAGIEGVTVDCDYDMGDVDRESAREYATDLINDIMGANSDVQFGSITINCMNGKQPIGALVQYERGEIFSRP